MAHVLFSFRTHPIISFNVIFLDMGLIVSYPETVKLNPSNNIVHSHHGKIVRANWKVILMNLNVYAVT